MPLLDHARSYRPLVQRIAEHVPREGCLATAGVPRAQLVALEYIGGFRVDALAVAETTSCAFMLQMETRAKPGTAGPRWQRIAVERRPTDREELTAIYRRVDVAP
jgi:hypothetical protein